MAIELACHGCGALFTADGPVGRSMRCARCDRALRCCLNCRFHDLSAYNECAEPSAERVLEKDRPNYCDYFSPRGGTDAAASAAKAAPTDGATGAISELERLFGKR